VTQERNQLRRGLTKAHGPQWVAKLDQMSQWAQRRMESEPRLKPLISAVMGLTVSTEETWGKKAIQDGEDPRAVIDTAFRTTSCCLASRLHPTPESDPSYSLAEVSDVVSGLWTRHPGARAAMAPDGVASLMRQAAAPWREILKQWDPQPHTLFQLGQLVISNSVFDSTFAAQLLPKLAANTYDSISFSIYESK